MRMYDPLLTCLRATVQPSGLVTAHSTVAKSNRPMRYEGSACALLAYALYRSTYLVRCCNVAYSLVTILRESTPFRYVLKSSFPQPIPL